MTVQIVKMYVTCINKKVSGKERENIWKAVYFSCKHSQWTQDACHIKWFFISCLLIKLIGLYSVYTY